MYKKIINSTFENYEIKKYKNGYMLGLIGANATLRIFISSTLTLDKTDFVMFLKHNMQYLFINLYNINFYNNLNYYKNIIQKALQQIWLKASISIQKFRNKLWFKGRNFNLKLLPTLFINRGYVQLFRFIIPNIFNVTFGKKQRYLRIRTDSFEWLYQYLFLIQQRNKPNNYTGKGIRVKNLILHKKAGKRKKTY